MICKHCATQIYRVESLDIWVHLGSWLNTCGAFYTTHATPTLMHPDKLLEVVLNEHSD